MVVRYLATALLSPVLSLPGTQGPKQAKNEVMREPRRNQSMLFVPAARLAHHRHANVLLQRIPRVPFQAPGGYVRTTECGTQRSKQGNCRVMTEIWDSHSLAPSFTMMYIFKSEPCLVYGRGGGEGGQVWGVGVEIGTKRSGLHGFGQKT